MSHAEGSGRLVAADSTFQLPARCRFPHRTRRCHPQRVWTVRHIFFTLTYCCFFFFYCWRSCKANVLSCTMKYASRCCEWLDRKFSVIRKSYSIVLRKTAITCLIWENLYQQSFPASISIPGFKEILKTYFWYVFYFNKEAL